MANGQLTPLGLFNYLMDKTSILKPAFQADPLLAFCLSMASWSYTRCDPSWNKTVRLRTKVLADEAIQNAEGTAMVDGYKETVTYGLWGMDRSQHPFQLAGAGIPEIECQAQVALRLAYVLKEIQDLNLWKPEPCAKVSIALTVHKKIGPLYESAAEEINAVLASRPQTFSVGKLGPVYTRTPATLFIAAEQLALLTDLAAGFCCGWYEPVFYKLVYRPSTYLPINLIDTMGLASGGGSFLDRAYSIYRQSPVKDPVVDEDRMRKIVDHYQLIVGALEADPVGWTTALVKHGLIAGDSLVTKGGMSVGGSKSIFDKIGDLFTSDPNGLPIWLKVILVGTLATGSYFVAKSWGQKKGGEK